MMKWNTGIYWPCGLEFSDNWKNTRNETNTFGGTVDTVRFRQPV